ncbi:DUF932 domain-containing protein [Microbacterium sp.]|uniref:DUF932 domain-containing protein n=1 Tax=Microbacterium sp. TaxID=51671 RepID=UPI003F95B968
MSAAIDELAPGTHAAIFARQDAWHRLGTTVTDAFTAQDALEKGHLGGWDVRKLPLTATEITEDGVTTVDVPDQFATVRTNPVTGTVEPLGVVGKSYRPIQNEAQIDLLDAIVDESGAHFETAGSIRGGKQTFVSMKMPRDILIGGKDAVNLYLIASTSHDGTAALRFVTAPVRVVCANTLMEAHRSATSTFSIRHTSGAAGRVQEARDALGMTFRYAEELETEANRMVDATITAGWFDQYIRDLYRVKPTDKFDDLGKGTRIALAQLRSLWENSLTLDGVRDTRWGAYNVFTEWVDHYSQIRIAGDKDAARAQRAVAHKGTVSLKRRAFDLALV